MAERVTTEKAAEIAPGIFQLTVPTRYQSRHTTLSYLVTGPQGHILIDTGMGSRAATWALQAQLMDQLGVRPGDVQLILITHNHPDHAGLATVVKEWTGAQTAMHRIDWEYGRRWELRSPEGRGRMQAWYARHGVSQEEAQRAAPHPPPPTEGDGRGSPSHDSPSAEEETAPTGDPHAITQPDILLEGGEVFFTGSATLEAVWTPGHTPGHLCFYSPDRRLLFTGDHILPVITSHVGLQADFDGDPLGDYLESVAKLGQLAVDLVLPAHQHHFTDLGARLQELQVHHDSRLQEVLQAADGEPKTAFQIAEGVSWNVGSWEEMDTWLRYSALGETLAHLEWLRRRGKVLRTDDEAVIRFAANGGISLD